MDFYKWIWSHTTGRPFTYLLRDIWHKCEFVWILGLIAVGVAMGHHYDWTMTLKIIGVFTLGFIFGHLFWGKEWVEDQQGSKNGTR